MKPTKPLASPSEFLQRLQWRYATKKFDPAKKIPADVWRSLEEAIILSPSSYGLQPWKAVVISDPALRSKLRTASWDQPQITDASHMIVFAYRRNIDKAYVEMFVKRIADVRKVPVDSLAAYGKMMTGSVEGGVKDINAWSQRQTFIGLGVFLVSAAVLGIDACPMEGFDPLKYDELLGLPAQGCNALVVATAGYRAADDAYAKDAKVRFAREDLIATM